jgi:hypothetical protein
MSIMSVQSSYWHCPKCHDVTYRPFKVDNMTCDYPLKWDWKDRCQGKIEQLSVPAVLAILRKGIGSPC